MSEKKSIEQANQEAIAEVNIQTNAVAKIAPSLPSLSANVDMFNVEKYDDTKGMETVTTYYGPDELDLQKGDARIFMFSHILASEYLDEETGEQSNRKSIVMYGLNAEGNAIVPWESSTSMLVSNAEKLINAGLHLAANGQFAPFKVTYLGMKPGKQHKYANFSIVKHG